MTDLITTSVATDRLIEFVKWRKAAGIERAVEVLARGGDRAL